MNCSVLWKHFANCVVNSHQFLLNESLSGTNRFPQDKMQKYRNQRKHQVHSKFEIDLIHTFPSCCYSGPGNVIGIVEMSNFVYNNVTALVRFLYVRQLSVERYDSSVTAK